MGVIDEPHHDGSQLYVSNPHPELDDNVTVFTRVPHGASVKSVHVRTIVDGEPAFTPAIVDRRDSGATWWRATMRAHNPVLRYRFLLENDTGGYRWLNGAGTHRRDILDASDFRLTTFGAPPSWAADAIVYQIFPDRFATVGPAAPLPSWAIQSDWDDPVISDFATRSQQVYGGTLIGVREKLGHIASLGVNTLYLTPFFPARSSHRYDASSFEHVDPLLGGNEALSALTGAAHARGMRVVGDLTTNHTGESHEWHQSAVRDAGSAEAAFYYWREHPHDYVSWLGINSLPKLNYGSAELARRLIDGPDSVVRKWLSPPYSLDGWRIDVANMTGRYRDDDYALAVARAVRAAMAACRPDGFLVAEHTGDATADLPGDGWHATMNYLGFTRPIWAWLSGDAPVTPFLGVPTPVPSWPGDNVVATMRAVTAAVPWSVAAHNLNLVGSHDTARIRTVVGSSQRVEIAATLLFTMLGLPMVYAGDEFGLEGDTGENGRRPMPWHRPDTWATSTLEAYRALARVRAASVALRHGGLRWTLVTDHALAFLRETAQERVLVYVARAQTLDSVVDADVLGLRGDAENLYGGAPLHAIGGKATLPGDGPTAQIWRLP